MRGREGGKEGGKRGRDGGEGGRERGIGLGGLCLNLPVLCYASNSWICSYYASYIRHIMLILCPVMYFDLKHMLVALVQNVLPPLT